MANDVSAYALLELFEDLGRQISAATGETGVLQAVTDVTAQAVPGADYASITRRRRGVFETTASTDERATKADELQYALLAGPCVAAAQQGHIFHVDDLASDTRWPQYGELAVNATGLHSVLSIWLELPEDELAGLNIYARQPAAFHDDDSFIVGTLLAAHASAAVSAAIARERAKNLEVALETNREIGVGIGVLMCRYKITREQAFDLLRVASQHTHRKVRDVAKDVADTGDLQAATPAATPSDV